MLQFKKKAQLFLLWMLRQPYKSKIMAFKRRMDRQPMVSVRKNRFFNPLILNSSFLFLQRLLIITFPQSQRHHISKVHFYSKGSWDPSFKVQLARYWQCLFSVGQWLQFSVIDIFTFGTSHISSRTEGRCVLILTKISWWNTSTIKVCPPPRFY